MFCAECGNKNDADARFCESCGNGLDKSESKKVGKWQSISSQITTPPINSNITRNIVVGVVIIVLLSFYFGVKSYANNVAKEEVNKVIAETVKYADISFDKVRVDLFGLDTRIKGITISPNGTEQKIRIDEIIIYDYDIYDKSKSNNKLHNRFAFKGIKITIDKNNFGNDAEKIKTLGYDVIKADIEFDGEYNEKEKEINIKKLRIGADEVGYANLKFHISNIEIPTDSENIFSFIFGLPEIKIHNARFLYEDDSLLPRIFKVAAAEEGIEVDEFIKKLTYEIDEEIDQSDTEFTKTALEELKKFVNDPKKISITLKPKNPTSIKRILKFLTAAPPGREKVEDPKKLIEFLNITVKS